MSNTAIHPKVAEISYMANDAYARELIERLSRKDEGRSKSRHKAAIQEIKRFHTEYKLGAEQYQRPKSRKKLLTIAAVCFLAPIFFAWIAEGKIQHQDQVMQEISFDYYPPQEQ
jgi:hypothetical protein